MLTPRILFASPEDSLINAFFSAVPDHSNILATNVLNKTPQDILAEARASSIEVIISRGGVAEYLKEAQRDEPDGIPIVTIQITTFDICEAIQNALAVSRNIAFLAHAVLLEDIRKVTSLFDLNIRFISHSAPWDCMEAVFKALESKAEIIVGDARVATICHDNNIPCVLLQSGKESFCQAWETAQRLCEARDRFRSELFRLTTVLDSLEFGVAAIGSTGRVVYANKKAEGLIGASQPLLSVDSIQKLPFFQRHIPSGFLGESSSSQHVIESRGKAEYKVSWNKLEEPQCGVSGLLTISNFSGVEHKAQPSSSSAKSLRFMLDDILGESPSIKKAKKLAQKYADSDATVLICGATGSGKELFAQAIHSQSRRRKEPFVAINLAAIPSSLVESELFGYVRGAFTDANKNGRQGVFEYAGKGTVFLDEIGEIAPEIQSRLLRVLQEGEFMRLGDNRTLKAQCRIIAATNKCLEHSIRCGTFREDLYYRLNILRLNVPSLDERREDIAPLAEFFLDRFRRKYAKEIGSLSRQAMDILLKRSWKGNVRELEGVIERLVVICEEGPVSASNIQEVLDQSGPIFSSSQVKKITDEDIQMALEDAHGNMNIAAKILGIHRTTLWRRVKKIE